MIKFGSRPRAEDAQEFDAEGIHVLTDIFSRRYANYPIWTQYTENEPRLMQQCIGVAKDVLPYFDSKGKVREDQKVKWKSIHDRLARELGLDGLLPARGLAVCHSSKADSFFGRPVM
jgi:hypothetical protein